jgi:23S rRNA A2030 N6-methylase RlmJ
MSARIVNNVKYIALMDDNNKKLQSFNDCIRCTLRDVFLNCDSESTTNKTSQLISLFKENENEYIIDNFNYKQIYGFLNTLEERSFYFIEGPFEEDTKYIEYNIWWENLQELIKKLKN